MLGFYANRLRTLFWTAFYHTLGRAFLASLGAGAKFQGWIELPQGGPVHVGQGVVVCPLVELTVAKGAELILADGVFIGRGVVISAHCRVSIGRNVMIGEYTSIHDNNHRRDDPFLPFAQQGFDAAPVEIGDDSWLGARTVVVKGGGVGRRCILGAGAVLTRRYPDGSVLVGVPARPLSAVSKENQGAA